MAQTVRFYLGLVNPKRDPFDPVIKVLGANRYQITCPIEIFNNNGKSALIVTACEYDPKNRDPEPGSAEFIDFKRFIGANSVAVENIAPYGSPWIPNNPNGVQFVLNVNEPTYVAVDVTMPDNSPIVLPLPQLFD